MIRQVLVSVVGHVDHGKSSLLDRIRGTTIVEREAGAITQAIGASIIPQETIKRVCGPLISMLKSGLNIPGFLAIDTPGHAAFSNLRKRGGSLADIAIVVVDLNEGFKPQTIEAIEILRTYKTPFIIAANKVDLIQGWRSQEGAILQNVNRQEQQTVARFEAKMYEIVGQMYEKFQMEAERFDRVSDYTKQIAIVPTSATTGEGIAELLVVLCGLAQKYLEQSLKVDPKAPAKGVVLEVKEDKGLGKTVDAIIYDGSLHVGDTIVIAGVEQPIVAKVKALFVPAPLAEMRDKKTKFTATKSVMAAAGVKISSKEIEDVVAGMPLVGVGTRSLDEVKAQVQEEVDEILLETDGEGVIVKADSIGSLEALIVLLREAKISIRSAGIGPISKKDILAAEGNLAIDQFTAVVLGFNVNLAPDIDPGKVKVFSNDVVYRLIEALISWQEGQRKALRDKEISGLVRPGKFMIMPGFIFRQSNPAVVGVQVIAGKVTSGSQVMNAKGETIAQIKTLQKDQETLSEATKDQQIAMSLTGVTVGRQINENDVLHIDIPEADFRKLKELKALLTTQERELLKEIALLKRDANPLWGV